MNGEVTDWIRGLGKFPEGSQIIFNPDGSIGAVMNGGKIYQPPEGVTIPGGMPTAEPTKGQDNFSKGLDALAKDPLGGIGKIATDIVTNPMGTFGSGVATIAGWSVPWLGAAAILGVAAIIIFVSLQALLKTEGS